jgi:hypothetical protein
MLTCELVENGDQEALGLARSGAGRYHHVATGGQLAHRLLLVPVEGPVEGHRLARDVIQPVAQQALIDELLQGRAWGVWRRDLQQGALGQGII